MNYILDKNTKIVLWKNGDSTKMAGNKIWASYNESQHIVVYSPKYNVNIGQEFKASIDNGVAVEFQVQKVWNKETLQERKLESWDDEINPKDETIKEPLYDTIEGKKVYKQFQNHVDGNWVVDEVAELEASIPQSMSPAQARLALLSINKLNDVVVLMEDSQTAPEAKILWEYATYFDRKNPVLINLATAIGLNSTEIDELFIAGAKINL